MEADWRSYFTVNCFWLSVELCLYVLYYNTIFFKIFNYKGAAVSIILNIETLVAF